MISGPLHVALDIGSVALKAVIFRHDGSFVGSVRRPIAGQLPECLSSVIEETQHLAGNQECLLNAVTGGRSESYANLLDVRSVSTTIAAYRGTLHAVPAAGAVLELGGEHSSFLSFGPSTQGASRTLEGVETNSSCSAGTGAFLEQEAHRFGLSIEEFGVLALRSRHPVRIAGRCAVFAKTDLVHKHQSGIPVEDLAYALCLGIARSVTSELMGSESVSRPLALIGGVAANPGMQRALRETLGLDEQDLIVPEQPSLVGAMGAALSVQRGSGHPEIPLRDVLKRLEHALLARTSATLPPLSSKGPGPVERPWFRPRAPRPGTVGNVIGIDIGSTSTNIAWLGADGTLKESSTVATRGDPLVAAIQLLQQLEIRHKEVAPRALGVTGSGRRLVAEMIGADFVVNEITAHARGCVHYFPDADTVFDIGGQDSKFISLEKQAVVGFEMNKVCSAGTGSFLEEMSALLGLNIRGEFEEEALRSRSPIELGERCTVFMGSEIARHLQDGCAREDLAAGLAYAVVKNYLTRVVGRNQIGSRVVFQGGVAANAAVVETLRRVLERDIVVHPFNHVAGAIGVALLAGRRARTQSRFRGAGSLDRSAVRTRSFSCSKCDNHCTVHVTRGPSRRRFFAGGLCDRYESGGSGDAEDTALDLFAERERMIERWVHDVPMDTAGAIGIPRALMFHEQLPFWAAFLDQLQIPYALSPETTIQTVEMGRTISRHGCCLPLATAYGHVAALSAGGVRRILVPSVASLSDRTVSERLNHACPSVQGWPYTTRALVDHGSEILAPRLRLGIPHLADRDLTAFAQQLGASARSANLAIEAGRDALRTFHDAMLRRGDDVFASPPVQPLVVLLTRSYTIGDPQVRLRFMRVLKQVGLTAVPMGMVRDRPQASHELHGMFWYYGKRLLQVAGALRELDRVAAISISNFGCGPDSFILHMLRRELGHVPLLELEVDEHNEFNGVHTRIEAFKWALGSKRRSAVRPPAPPGRVSRQHLSTRRLYIPRMSDHAFAFAAAFRSCGVDAEVLPEPSDDSIALGRAAVDGSECLPCAFLLGDMLHHCATRDPGQPAPAFFMIGGDGPCRLGQYPWLQRAVLDDRGFSDVPIFNASQDTEFYQKFGMMPTVFRRLAWNGTVAIDLLFRKWREQRVRAVDRSEVDEVYRGQLQVLANAIELRSSLADTLNQCFDVLENVRHRDGVPVATVGLLGENYVRCNATSNANLVDALEQMGLEVWFPSLCEWVLYTNWTARLHCRYDQQAKRWFVLRLVDALQRYEMAHLTRSVRGRLNNAAYPSVRGLLRLAARYMPRTLEGETALGIGRTVDFHRRGLDGVIHVSPFGCMVGRIVEALCRKVSDDLEKFPVLHLEYDGRSGENVHGRLESFAMQAVAWTKKGKAAAGA